MYSFLLNVGTQKDSVMHCIVVLSFRSVVLFLSYHFLIIRFIMFFFSQGGFRIFPDCFVENLRINMLANALIPGGGHHPVVVMIHLVAFLTLQEVLAGNQKRWCKKPLFSTCPSLVPLLQAMVIIPPYPKRVIWSSIGGHRTQPFWSWAQWWWNFLNSKVRNSQQGVLTSESAAAVVSALSSRDLEILAPVVERFVDGVDLPVSEMDTMLLDHKNRGLDYSEASWRNVTCTLA